MIAARALPVLVVVAWASVANAANVAAFEAQLSWAEAHASGEVTVVGTAWAWNIEAPMRAAGGPPMEGALLSIEGAKVVVQEDTIDYKSAQGNPGKLGADPEPRQKKTTIDSGSLKLAGARPTLGMLGTPSGPADAAFSMNMNADSIAFTPRDGISLRLFAGHENVGDGDLSLDRTYERAGSAVGATPAAVPETFEVRGDFVFMVWDIDLQDKSGNVYRSGVMNSNGVTAGAYGEIPNGVVYDSREQVLTVFVTDGRLAMLIPDRTPGVYLDPAAIQVTSEGTWELRSAAGRIEWGRGVASVRDEAVRIVGGLTATLGGASDGVVRSTWSGEAAEVSAGATPMELKSVSSAQPAGDRFLFWGVPLGIALLGAGGGAFLVVHRRQAPRGAPAPATQPTPVREDHEARLAAAVQKLQSGLAAEVAADLEASFDEKHEAAPFQAYVLSLAHLQLQDTDAAADWFLVAARLYPDFAKELPVNDSLKALRVHPRVRGFLKEAARTGGLPPDVSAELGLVEESVAYV